MLRLTYLISSLVPLAACVPATEVPSTESSVTQLRSARVSRAEAIRAEASRFGLHNGSLLVAGIANAETSMAHCWDDARWACQGPASPDCAGGPVIAGAGDGPCWWKEGGLGMFQFDAGTHNMTLEREGRDILTMRGNIRSGIEFILNMVINSNRIYGVSNPNEALTFLNRAMPGTAEYNNWLATVVQSYNGCVQGNCAIFWSRYDHYDNRTRALTQEFGSEFWRKPVTWSDQPEPNTSTGEGYYEVTPGSTCWEAADALGCAIENITNCTADRPCTELLPGDQLRCGGCDGETDTSDGVTRTYTITQGGTCWDAANALHCDLAKVVNCTGDRSCQALWPGDQLACSYQDCP